MSRSPSSLSPSPSVSALRARGRRRPLLGLLGVTGLGLLLGCSPPEREIESEARYEPPRARSIVVETVVDLPFEAAWSELIRRLSESSFHVSTLEKASRFVRVDLARSSDLASSGNRPSRFVDCGRTIRRFQASGEAETKWEYAVSGPSRYREADPTEAGYRVSEVERRVDLDASATIYLQPEGQRRTRVTVKSRYRVQFEIAGTARLVPRDADEAPSEPVDFGPRVESIRFTTFQPGQDRRQGGLTCRTTGEFEHALIALVNPAAAI